MGLNIVDNYVFYSTFTNVLKYFLNVFFYIYAYYLFKHSENTSIQLEHMHMAFSP